MVRGRPTRPRDHFAAGTAGWAFLTHRAPVLEVDNLCRRAALERESRQMIKRESRILQFLAVFQVEYFQTRTSGGIPPYAPAVVPVLLAAKERSSTARQCGSILLTRKHVLLQPRLHDIRTVRQVSVSFLEQCRPVGAEYRRPCTCQFRVTTYVGPGPLNWSTIE